MLRMALLVWLAVPGAGAPPVDPKHAPDAERAARRIRHAAAGEARRLGPDHAWAGSYYWGDGLGANVSLDLAPEAGFVFEWHGCLGLYDRNHGSIEVVDGVLHLRPILPNPHEGFQGLDERLVPVAWEDRRYLIPDNRLRDFCNAMNDGSEPRDHVTGQFLLRRGDEKKAVEGGPHLPDGMEGCILAAPIVAHVVEVVSTSVRTGRFLSKATTMVTLDVGDAEGAWTGMRFHDDEGNHDVAVVTVAEHTSEARVDTFIDTGHPSAPPAVGLRLSTRVD